MWCTLCAQPVHNLSALDAAEQAKLLARPGPLCVSYRLPRALLAGAAALLLAGPAADLHAQDSGDAGEELDDIVVIGGGIRRPEPQESVFLESAPPESEAQPTMPSDASKPPTSG